MINIIGVRFKPSGKIYYFDPGEFIVEKDSSVIVETIRGVELGIVVIPNKEIPENQIVSPLKTVIRTATEDDLEQNRVNKAKEPEALIMCQKKIDEHKLAMKLIDVEYTFDGNKVLFYFTADGRVDFRDLVKDLAGIFKTRIELRQIGVRDESKMLGGLGICGRVFCCHSHSSDFQPVSIKMAKEQGLSLNPTKISGTCGRLMCCLKYEQEAYEDLLDRVPGVGSIVMTDQGKGIVKEVNLLREQLKVELENENIKELIILKASDVKVLKKRRNNSFADNETSAEDLKKILD